MPFVVVIVVFVIAVVVIAVVVVVVVIPMLVIVIVLVSLTHHEYPIDGIALGIDDLDVLEQPVEGFGLAHLGDEVGDGVVLLVCLANLVGLLTDLHRNACVLGIEVVDPDGTPIDRSSLEPPQVDAQPTDETDDTVEESE